MPRILLILAAALVVWLAPGGAQGPSLRARVYASGFQNPVAFVQDPTDAAVQYVLEQGGLIRAVRAGTVLAANVLDLTASVLAGGERGLLGLAFAPDYAASGRFYVNFTNRQGHTVVARLRRSGNPVVADPDSRFDLRWGGPAGPAFIEQPFANHNGGHLVFGPDGHLYVGLGDGGSANDPSHRAQDPSELLGKMLRIDVNVPDDDPAGYRVPGDNPFAGAALGARPEIWSFGLRNPWRYSFDEPSRGGTGALIIGDVGQNRYEEIDYEPPRRGGRNYGWRNREGAHDNVTTAPPAFTPLIDPVHEYDRSAGNSVTGGFVYRGRALGAAFQGRYFFADLSGRVWSLALALDPATGEARVTNIIEHTGELGTPGAISSFGLDADGELYIVEYSTGRILRIDGQPSAPATPVGLRIIRN